MPDVWNKSELNENGGTEKEIGRETEKGTGEGIETETGVVDEVLENKFFFFNHLLNTSFPHPIYIPDQKLTHDTYSFICDHIA